MLPNSESNLWDLICVEDSLWVVTAPTGSPTYDFAFDRFFRCTHPIYRPETIQALARVGAHYAYDELYHSLELQGIHLLHSPEVYRQCSDLRGWYPRLHDLTAKTLIFDDWPKADVIDRELGWPIFVKGVRQTSRHRVTLSRVDTPEALERLQEVYRTDRILHWQPVACRAWLPLRAVSDTTQTTERIPASFEFRCFFWRGRLVGFGKYWWQADYKATQRETEAACRIAQTAADRMQVPFLVVDVAQCQDGSWIVIECNDGQESGYAGISPIALWNELLAR